MNAMNAMITLNKDYSHEDVNDVLNVLDNLRMGEIKNKWFEQALREEICSCETIPEEYLLNNRKMVDLGTLCFNKNVTHNFIMKLIKGNPIDIVRADIYDEKDYSIYYWDVISCLEDLSLEYIEKKSRNIVWSNVCYRSRHLTCEFLEKHKDKICWDMLLKNPNTPFDFLRRNNEEAGISKEYFANDINNDKLELLLGKHDVPMSFIKKHLHIIKKSGWECICNNLWIRADFIKRYIPSEYMYLANDRFVKQEHVGNVVVRPSNIKKLSCSDNVCYNFDSKVKDIISTYLKTL